MKYYFMYTVGMFTQVYTPNRILTYNFTQITFFSSDTKLMINNCNTIIFKTVFIYLAIEVLK